MKKHWSGLTRNGFVQLNRKHLNIKLFVAVQAKILFSLNGAVGFFFKFGAFHREKSILYFQLIGKYNRWNEIYLFTSNESH